QTNIDGHSVSRVMNFDPNTVGGLSDAISGFTVTGGNAATNAPDGYGGGAGIIAGSGNATTIDTMSADDLVVKDNIANSGQQSVLNEPGGGMAYEGGNLTVTNSSFIHNTAYTSSGSGLWFGSNQPGAQLSVSGTTFDSNYGTSHDSSTGGIK